MTYDRSRIVRAAGRVRDATLAEIERALRVHLELGELARDVKP